MIMPGRMQKYFEMVFALAIWIALACFFVWIIGVNKPPVWLVALVISFVVEIVFAVIVGL